MATLINALSNNSYAIDAAEAEKSAREKEPKLFHADETVKLAFKSALDGRDKSYLTSHRILVKDGKGIGNKKKEFVSIPYTSILAFSVETAGSFDSDTELKVFTDAGQQKIEFGKGVVDIFAVQQFLNTMILSQQAVSKGTVDAVISGNSNSNAGNLVDWLGNNATEVSPADMENKLKNEYTVLMADEKVELAYKCWRDYTVFTDHRMVIVDVQGLTGKRVEFISIPWEHVRGYSVETPGSFLDFDSELRILTNIPDLKLLVHDLRKGKGNLWAIQTCLNNHLLGPDEDLIADVDSKEGHVDPSTSIFGRGNSRPLDAVEVNKTYHTNPPILQSKETVEMAFKGIRDILIFTNKRVIMIDTKGLTGNRVEYKSMPWTSIIGFAVETAGTVDNDTEMYLWTEMCDLKAGDNKIPYWSMWSHDFNKNLVDIIAVKKYVATRILKATDVLPNAVPVPPNTEHVSESERGVERFLSKIGNDQSAVDPNEMNALLHNDIPILLENETIVMAFKAGRDATFFTNMRVIVLDTKGWSGKKVQYLSLLYTSIVCFSAASAGGWDRDSEVELFTRNDWNLKCLSMDFRKGKADIGMIQKFLSAVVLGSQEDQAKYLESAGGDANQSLKINLPGMDSFVSFVTRNSVEVDAGAVSEQLHSDPPILLDGEHCEKVYSSGRDMYVYTNLRYLNVDSKGLTGKKIKYTSMPCKNIRVFVVETAGHMDRDSEIILKALGDVSAKQDILAKQADVMDMHVYLTNKLMFTPNTVEC